MNEATKLKKHKLDCYFMDIAKCTAELSNCQSLQVGACVVSEHNRVLATGYNGTPAGSVNCCDKFNKAKLTIKNAAGNAVPCSREVWRDLHHAWSLQHEIHAEVNCIISATRNNPVMLDSARLYVTTMPCDQCLKVIAAAGIKEVIYLNAYDKSSELEINALASELGITVNRLCYTS